MTGCDALREAVCIAIQRGLPTKAYVYARMLARTRLRPEAFIFIEEPSWARGWICKGDRGFDGRYTTVPWRRYE